MKELEIDVICCKTALELKNELEHLIKNYGDLPIEMEASVSKSDISETDRNTNLQFEPVWVQAQEYPDKRRVINIRNYMY